MLEKVCVKIKKGEVMKENIKTIGATIDHLMYLLWSMLLGQLWLISEYIGFDIFNDYQASLISMIVGVIFMIVVFLWMSHAIYVKRLLNSERELKDFKIRELNK